MRLVLAALLLVLALPALAAAPPGPPWQSQVAIDNPLVGRIWLPAEQRFIETDELARRLSAADFVLLGEHHDNPDHHRLQAWALSEVIAAGRRPLVAVEMITPEKDAVLRRQLAEHPKDVDGLGEALDWANSQWPQWSFYRPIFAEALGASLTLRPANLPNDLVRSLARRQEVPEGTRRHYRLDQPVDPAVVEAMAQEIRADHCDQLPEKVVPGMVDVQRARDVAMALAMTADALNGAVLIAGDGHTRTDRGVPVQVAALAPGRPIFSLGFLEVDGDESDPVAYGDSFDAARPPFDAVWFTPRFSDKDPCAGMAEFMKKKQEKEKEQK